MSAACLSLCIALAIVAAAGCATGQGAPQDAAGGETNDAAQDAARDAVQDAAQDSALGPAVNATDDVSDGASEKEADGAVEGEIVRLEPGPFRDLLFVPDPDALRVSLRLVVGAGEATADGPEGIAHYVEHLAWLSANGESAKARTAERDSNARTGPLTTSYFETVAADDLSDGLAKLVGVLEPFTLTERFMREERQILRHEYKLRAGDEWEEALRRDTMRRLHATNGFARSPLGTPDSLAALTVADARELHARTHRAANTTLLVSGSIAADRVAEALATLPAALLDASGEAEPAADPGELVPLRDEGNATGDANSTPFVQVIRRFREPPVEAEADTPARRDARHRLLYLVLDSTRAGGLAGPLRFDAFLAERFDLWLTPLGPEQAVLGFYGTPDRGVELDALQRSFETTLATSAANGLPATTLDAVRRNLLADLDRRGSRGADTRSRAMSLLEEGRSPYGFAEWRRAIVDTRADEIDALLERAAAGGRTVIRRVAPVSGQP